MLPLLPTALGSGIAAFTAIFALYLVGLWNYSPADRASKSYTFSDRGVGAAKELCADPTSERYCELVCMTDGKETDFQGNADALGSWAMFEFTVYILEVVAMGMGVVAAWKAGNGVPCDGSAPMPSQPKGIISMLKAFMAAWCILFILRAIFIFGAASAFKASITNDQAYLLNQRFDEKGEYIENDGPECTEKWLDSIEDGYEGFMFLSFVGLVLAFIFSGFAVYNASLVKQDLLYHPSQVQQGQPLGQQGNIPVAQATAMPIATATPIAVGANVGSSSMPEV